ncbi:MAG: DUF1670 domain-containing protein [Thermodesulfobacteriota bacterium]
MNKHASSNEANFCPQTYKTFEGALEAFFSKECPQLGGFRTRQVLVQSIAGMVAQFFPETSHMKPGQITWPTVHKNETSSYGKSIKETELTTVILDLVQQHDALDRAKGKKLRIIKKEAVARLCEQAYQQDGCLTNAELAIMLKISPGTVGKYINEWELEHKQVLPRRGSIHDMGPTLTHKKIIIHKLFIEGKSVQMVSRETHHSPGAIQRYISTFKQVLLCRQKGMNTDEIAFAIKRTKRLVKEYENLIEEYKENNYIVSSLLKCEVEIEPNREVSEN